MEELMAQSKEQPDQIVNSFGWSMPPAFPNAMMTILAHLNGTLLERVADAQKEWAEFVQRRVREDVAVSRQLLNCQSLADIPQIYSDYLQTAFQQYREQSEKVAQGSKNTAQHFAETTRGNLREAARARQ